jgi:hypothetical protein
VRCVDDHPRGGDRPPHGGVSSENFSDSALLKHVDLRLYGDIGSVEGDTLHLAI